MTSSAREGVKESKRGRVLFSGSGDSTIRDLMAHAPQQYQTTRCVPVGLSLADALEKSHPHVLVLCLLDESGETLRIYHELEENPTYAALPVIVIGYEADCSIFKKRVMVKELKVFTRPLDQARFLETLKQQIEMAMEAEKQLLKEDAAEKLEEERASAQARLAAEAVETARLQEVAHFNERQSILVVDDDVRMLNVIKLYLQDLYDITLVPSGKLALKFLAKRSVDLVLLDYMMPGEDGPAVLQQIRESTKTPNVPVLFLTGVSDKDMVLRGLAFNPNGYLLKPTTKEVLIEKITKVLSGI